MQAEWWLILQDVLILVANMAIACTMLIWYSQHRKTNNITSITKCKECIDRLRKQKLTKTNNLIFEGKSSECDETKLEKLLNEYEDLALYWDEKVVYFRHIEQMHGAILSTIKKDSHVMNTIHEYNKKDGASFSRLIKLLKKIDEKS